MSKFKIGDRVRRNSPNPTVFEKNGDIGTIIENSNDGVPFVRWDRAGANNGQSEWPELEDYLELIEAPSPKHTMEMPKFKVGDRVRRIKDDRKQDLAGDTGTVRWAYRIYNEVVWDRDGANTGNGFGMEYTDNLELIEAAPATKHTTYTPDGVTISMELEWEIARLLGMIQADCSAPLNRQANKINQMWMGK